METILVRREDGVVTVTLNRPERRNAINTDMATELTALLDEVAERHDDRALVVTGAGDAFCSGGDLSQKGGEGGTAGALARMRHVNSVALRIHELARPTIAAVNGPAFGAGCNLALGCDLVLASDRARFCEIFVPRGFTLDYGGTWLLPRLVGLQRAKEIAFLGEDIPAARAAELGLVTRVVSHDELQQATQEMAHRLASMPPLSLRVVKAALNRSYEMSMSEAIEQESIAQILASSSPEAAEAMRRFGKKKE
jgi:2-(1,2-epoxy-1,2-dihydrophenyl)acetyl-CoA isomerase